MRLTRVFLPNVELKTKPKYMGLIEHIWLALYAAVVLALCIDQWIGEPPPRWHPVVWMGNYLVWVGIWVQQYTKAEGQDWRSFWRGAVAWTAGAVLVLLLAGAWQWLLWQLHWGIAVVLMGISLKPLLSWRMLTDEVQAVEQQLGISLQHGQQQLARLVSRDVTVLDATQVRESALETLAENLNDSIIAPLFWFALLGLPGAALYRFADTADSMWGYKDIYQGQRWEWAGKWVAKADDVLAWLPARITACVLLLAGGVMQHKIHAPAGLWGRARQLPTQARLTTSPNSGWSMAAMALVLDVCLRKPNVYTLHAQGSTAHVHHIAHAVRLSTYTLVAAMLLWASVYGVWVYKGLL